MVPAWVVVLLVLVAFAAGSWLTWDHLTGPRKRLTVADISTIRTALASQITNVTGLRTLAEAKDQISPPVAVILPGVPLARYGDTLDGALTINLRILLCISDAPPVEKVQRAIDAYLGIGGNTTVSSIPAALMKDPTLAGAVHWAIPIQVSSYGRIDYAGETYFGGRLDVQLGAI